MIGLSRTGHPRRGRPAVRSFQFGGLDPLQLALTVVGALLFLSAIVIAVGPIDPISPQPVADADDDQLASGGDPGSTSAGGETGTPESANTPTPTDDDANGPSEASSPDSGAVDDDGSEGEDDIARGNETNDDEFEQVPTFDQLKEERKSLEQEHKHLEDEHKRLKPGKTSEEEWEQHQEEYEAHRERFRAHRADFEAYVERYGSDEETVKHRQWLEKFGAEHTIHDIRSERD